MSSPAFAPRTFYWLRYLNSLEFRPEQELEIGRCVSGVYVLLDFAGGVLYVGESCDVARRLEEHRLGTGRFVSDPRARYSTKPKDFHRAVFAPVATASDRLRVESTLILTLCPRLNRRINIGITAEGAPYQMPRHGYKREAASKGAHKKARRRVAKGLGGHGA